MPIFRNRTVRAPRGPPWDETHRELNPDDPALVIVIDDDSVRDRGAVLDGTVSQIEINGIRRTIQSRTHGFVISSVGWF